jgi:hypothetical protein
MILEKGNMWDIYNETDAFVITTNPVKRTDGAVVMGRGIALEAKTRFPNLPYVFGEVLNLPAEQHFFGKIGLFDSKPIYYFMVKDHWKNNASLNIIASSCYFLKSSKELENKRVDLNFPGIGNGKLNRESVLYLLQDLPNNIHIWEYS